MSFVWVCCRRTMQCSREVCCCCFRCCSLFSSWQQLACGFCWEQLFSVAVMSPLCAPTDCASSCGTAATALLLILPLACLCCAACFVCVAWWAVRSQCAPRGASLLRCTQPSCAGTCSHCRLACRRFKPDPKFFCVRPAAVSHCSAFSHFGSL